MGKTKKKNRALFKYSKRVLLCVLLQILDALIAQNLEPM